MDPRLDDRNDDLIQQYAEIYDVLPPIEINQNKEVIDGWHRYLAARRVDVAEIACVVVETADDDDLADRMWEAKLRHGVQYSRDQRKTYGVKLHGRGLSAKDIADRAGVGVNTVYRWTKELREKDKEDRDQAALELAEKGKTQQEIAEALQIDQGTVSRIMQDSQMVEMHKSAESLENTDYQSESETPPPDESESEELPADETESAPDADEAPVEETSKSESEQEAKLADETPEEMEVVSAETDLSDTPADEKLDNSDPESAPDADDVTADEEATTLAVEVESEPSPPEAIPQDIVAAARAVMGIFSESRPDGYVARLETVEGEWMTITDLSVSNDLERELLNSAVAMCLWDEQMIWYQGVRTNAFTDCFGKIGPVFVRGQAGQWSIASRLRSLLRRMWG